MHHLVTVCLAATIGLAGCATSPATDPLQATDNPTAATPARSPAPSTPAAGTVLPAPAADHTAIDPTTGTLAVASDRTLLLYSVNTPDQPPRSIPLPGHAASLRLDHGAFLAALPDAHRVTAIDPTTGQQRHTTVTGEPVDAVHVDNVLAVALRDRGEVLFLRDNQVTSRTTGFRDPAQLLPLTGSDGKPDLYVLDRVTTALTPVDPRTGNASGGVRVGQGATHAVVDNYQRVLLTDTRMSEYYAVSADPLVLKQQYPVGGTPYDIAYDPTRDLAWITLTGTNEVIGYDVAGGEPHQRHRLPTVRQPNSVAVNPTTGQVYVTSATGDGIQEVTP